jgi:hypothetical protein
VKRPGRLYKKPMAVGCTAETDCTAERESTAEFQQTERTERTTSTRRTRSCWAARRLRLSFARWRGGCARSASRCASATGAAGAGSASSTSTTRSSFAQDTEAALVGRVTLAHRAGARRMRCVKLQGIQYAPLVQPWLVKGVQIAPRLQTMVGKRGMGAKLHPWFVVEGAMLAALAVVPASLHPLYTGDDRCSWLLLHTLCAMHTAVCERDSVQHHSGARGCTYLPQGIYGARLLFFVSARTNKRHHHHQLQSSVEESCVRNTGPPPLCACGMHARKRVSQLGTPGSLPCVHEEACSRECRRRAAAAYP